MRRSFITVAGAGLFTVMGLLPAIAQDAPNQEAPQQVAPDESPDKANDNRPDHKRVEHLDLRCGQAEAGNGCQWSHAKHPKFAAYELWRGVNNGQTAERTMVFRTEERRVTRYLDADGPDKAFYVVRVVDAQGHMIGHSNPARVGARPHAKPTPARPEPVLAPVGLEGPHPQPARPDRPEAADKQHDADRPAKPADSDKPRPAERPNDERRDKVEPLELACRPVKAEGREGIGCKWSQAQHPDFAGYRLMRASRDARPAPVFHTRDRGQTMTMDRSAEPGTAYMYVIEALNADGKVIGRSRPVRVGANDHREPTRPEPVIGDPAAPVAEDVG